MHKLKAKPSLKNLKGIAKKKPSDSSPDTLEYDVRHPINLYFQVFNAIKFLGWTNKSVLYDRPFFMVIGPEGSGKTSFFSSTNLRFPLQHPSKDDGYLPGESVQPPVVWYCNENAVWLDLPGYCISSDRSNLFDSIASQMGKIRAKRPVDGVVVAVSCAFFLSSTVEEINELAHSLRETIDILIKKWGLELPVYLIFTHTDTLTGFEALFSDESGGWNRRILGTTLTENQDTEYPYTTFLTEFNTIQQSLEQIRIQMIYREQNPEKRLAICQFPIVFNILRERLGAFIAALFHSSSLSGKPVFSGFYFTSIKTITVEEQQQPDSIGDSLGALFDHPLNPQFGRKAKKSVPGKKPKTWFIHPLIAKLIPESIPAVNTTDSRYQRDLRSLLIRIGIAAVVAITFLIVLLVQFNSIKTHEKEIKNLIDSKPTLSEEGIQKIWQLYTVYDSLSKASEAPSIFSRILTGYSPNRIQQTVKQQLLTMVQEVLLIPGFNAIGNGTTHHTLRKLSFETLKNNLHVYLALSSYRSSDQVIDTTVYRNSKSLAKLLCARIENTMRTSGRLDRDTKNKLNTMVTNQLVFLKNGEVTNAPDADEGVVSLMQEALSKKSSEQVIYGQILEQSFQQTDSMLTLGDIISEDISPDIASVKESLPILFTPDGWKEYIYPFITTMTDNVSSVDAWIFGPYESNVHPDKSGQSELKFLLYNDYLEQCAQQWYTVLESFSIPPFTSTQDAEKKLHILAGKRSPIQLLLSQLVQWSDQFTVEDSTVDFSAPVEKFKKDISFIKILSEDFLPDYQTALAAVAEGISGQKSVAELFNNTENDPLRACYSTINTTIIPNFQSNQKVYITSLCTQPLEHSARLLTAVLPKELNTIWKNHICTRYNEILKNRYPVQDSRDAKESPFTDVMDFFHPQNGYINRFKMQYLSHWLSDDQNNIIPVNITSNGRHCLKTSERITRLFYREAALRSWDIALKSIDQNVSAVIYNLGTQNPPDTVRENAKKLSWPGGEEYGTITFIRKNPATNTERSYPYEIEGPWAVMQLLNAGAIFNKTYNISPFTCKITLQESGGKDISVMMKADISSTIHPFCLNPFAGFFVPEEIVEKSIKK